MITYLVECIKNNDLMREKVIEILSNLRPEFDFTEEVDFIEEGMIDSFDLISLVSTLDEEFRISISGLDVIHQNFSSVDSIVALLTKNGVE